MAFPDIFSSNCLFPHKAQLLCNVLSTQTFAIFVLMMYTLKKKNLSILQKKKLSDKALIFKI